jgi:hypothetical protein
MTPKRPGKDPDRPLLRQFQAVVLADIKPRLIHIRRLLFFDIPAAGQENSLAKVCRHLYGWE